MIHIVVHRDRNVLLSRGEIVVEKELAMEGVQRWLKAIQHAIDEELDRQSRLSLVEILIDVVERVERSPARCAIATRFAVDNRPVTFERKKKWIALNSARRENLFSEGNTLLATLVNRRR